jgi:photosystem II stability/assembly factor-like uncharacterized protein
MEAMVYVGTVGQNIWRSRDGGETWARVGNGMLAEETIRALVPHPANPTLLYAGTDNGVWRSENGGDTWEQLGGPMTGMHVWSLLVDPRRPERIFAGTSPPGIFRSEDGGRQWRQLPVQLVSECAGGAVIPRVTCLLPDPERPECFWAGVEIDGVRRTEDGGDTWTAHNEGLTTLDIHGLAVLPGGGGTPLRLVATTNADIFLSDDRGASFRALRVKGLLPWSYCRGVQAASDDPSVLYAGIGNGPPGDVGGLARSRDRGETWASVALPVTPNSTIWNLASNAADPRLWFGSSVSGYVYRSRDGGATWEKLAREFGEIRALLWVPR